MGVVLLWLQVLPDLATDNQANQCLSDSVFRCELVLICFSSIIASSNIQNRTISQASPWHAFSTRLPALGNLVSYIDCLSSEKKMNGIDAGRVVTTVKDGQSDRDCPDEKFIRGSGSYEHSAFSGARANKSIAMVISASGPENTAIRRLGTDVAKEAIDERNCFVFLVTSGRAVLALAPAMMAPVDKKGDATEFTDAFDFDRLFHGHVGG